jgi:hypothetical protein
VPPFRLREREPAPRLALLRDAEERDDFAAPLLARFAVERFAGDLRAVEVRVAPEFAVFARVDVERFAVDFRAVDLRAVDRFAVDLRAGFDALLELVDVLAAPSIDHLPDITRCAASATASAMIDPNLVALETTLLAACDAVSAASRPASRIFLRAVGLAAIAAAAAVNPAASISLLIAAFASLSTVLSLEREPDADEFERDEDELEPEREEPEREELLRVDLAIAYLPPGRKDTSGPFRFPNDMRTDQVAQCFAQKM